MGKIQFTLQTPQSGPLDEVDTNLKTTLKPQKSKGKVAPVLN
jgi:hypothetical protein